MNDGEKPGNDIIDEIRKHLPDINREFIRQNVPAKERVFHACRELARLMCNRFPDGFPMFQAEFRAVEDYFSELYEPEAIRFPKYEVPYCFEGEIYYYRIPILINMTVQAMAEFDPTTCLQAPQQVIARLKQDPTELAKFSSDFHVRLKTRRIFGEYAGFAGIEDYREAVDNLRSERFNHAAWSVLQCAEKAMKAILAVGGLSENGMRRLGHNLRNIHGRAVEFEPFFADIAPHVEVCHA